MPVLVAHIRRTAAPLTEARSSKKSTALLAQMTLAEKVGQLTQAGAFPGMDPAGAVRQGGAGSVLWLNDPKQFNALQKIAVEETRLKIPVLFALDVIHGYRTIFPVPLAMAASWDPAGYEKAQAVAAREARAAACTGPSRRCSTSRATRAGAGWSRAPARIRISARRWPSPRCAASRAPTLGAPERLIACAKHFAGYGAADGGRDYDPVYVPENLLRNVYLPPFQAAAKAGVGSFMSAYMDLNDVPATANRFLLRDVLRGEWGFKGFVVSDAFGVANLVTQGSARDGGEAARRALLAGLDVDMAQQHVRQEPRGRGRGGPRADGADRPAVRPILAAKVRLGLFEHPYVDEAKLPSVLQASAHHRQRARAAAQRTMVLLRNEGEDAAAAQGRRLDRGHRPGRRLEGRHRGLVAGLRSPRRRR